MSINDVLTILIPILLHVGVIGKYCIVLRQNVALLHVFYIVLLQVSYCIVLLQVLDKYVPADDFLPESYTCFFLLKMPRYTSIDVLREKLKYAIHFCKSIGKSKDDTL